MYPKNPMSEGRAHSSTPSRTKPAPSNGSSGRRIQVRRSGVHGKGVFALQPIRKGETIVEYTGEIISWKEADRRHPHDPDNPLHTFYFTLESGKVIDGLYGDNAAKWINHSCAPNCEADEEDGHVFIKALRRIEPGEELNYDYGLVLDGKHTQKVKREYACHCGSRKCRGTMLGPKG